MSVELERNGRVAVIKINRPRAFNSLDVAHYREFSERLAEFNDDDGLMVAIISGEGRAFSIGADIKDMLPYLREHRDDPSALPPTIMRGMEIWKPLIAAVNGMALGGGLEIALACDIRIASAKARLGAPEITLGFIPGWGGTQRLARMLTHCRAAEMIFSGGMIDAEEAYRIGLVNRVVPHEDLMNEVMKQAEAICQVAPLALRAAKRALLRGGEMTLEDGLRLERELAADLMGTEDFNEGITAYLERRRKPNFQGR
jgi:enoyl-CoA hydratase/carnithine racemase